jgi:hypothetical protein
VAPEAGLHAAPPEEIVPATEAMLAALLLAQAHTCTWSRTMMARPGLAAAMLQPPHRAGVMLRDGAPVVAIGVIQHWPGRAEAWLLAPEADRRDKVRALRAARHWLDAAQTLPEWRRIEFYVIDGTPHGDWLRALGFEAEGRARCWAPDGRDATLFVRISGVTS